MKTKLIVLACALATVVLAGCNTMAGVGKDVERGGQKVQNEANEHR